MAAADHRHHGTRLRAAGDALAVVSGLLAVDCSAGRATAAVDLALAAAATGLDELPCAVRAGVDRWRQLRSGSDGSRVCRRAMGIGPRADAASRAADDLGGGFGRTRLFRQSVLRRGSIVPADVV